MQSINLVAPAICISEEVAQVLFQDLKHARNTKGDDGMDAFRYEMFAKRIIAAQHGRHDAVKWAVEWLGQIIDDTRKEMEDAMKRLSTRAAAIAQSRAEFENGTVGNPYYQAFLDTIEDPASVRSNHHYIIWNMDRSSEYNQYATSCKKLQQQPMTFGEFLKDYAEKNLSERVIRKRQAMK